MACVVDLLKDCFSDCTGGLVETKSDKIDRLEKEAGKARAKGQTTKAEGLEAKVRGLKGEPPAAAPSAAQGAFAAVDGSEKAVTAQPGGDVVSKIKGLKALLDEGTLSQAEFDAAKAKVLAA